MDKELSDRLDRLEKLLKTNDLVIKGLYNKISQIVINLQLFSSKLDLLDLKAGNELKLPEEKQETLKEISKVIASEDFVIQESKLPISAGRHTRSEDTRQPEEFTEYEVVNQTKTELSQRVLDKSKKSVFMAAVEFKDKNNALVLRTNTKANGKYLATLPVGTYNVIVSKQASLNSPRLESKFSIDIDGTKEKMELPDVVI